MQPQEAQRGCFDEPALIPNSLDARYLALVSGPAHNVKRRTHDIAVTKTRKGNAAIITAK